MITLSIDTSKIDKSLLKEVTKRDGTTTKFLNIVCFANKDGKDAHDNDGIVKHSLTKDQRDAGIQSPIIGNYKDKSQPSSGNNGWADKIKPAKAFQNRPKPAPAPADDFDDIPF
jgi:hypothetical protein